MALHPLVRWLPMIVVLPTLSLAQGLYCSAGSCTYDNIALKPATLNNPWDHYYIAGLFGVHDAGPNAYECGAIRSRGLQNLEAFFWAINRYSPAPTVVSIGGVGLDSCSREPQAIENVLSFETCKVGLGNIQPRNLMAYVGPDRSSEAESTANLLKDMNRTQISHAATSPSLSNDDQFPYFLRTVPSDANDAGIMAEILERMNVKYVQAVYLDNLYGMNGLKAFKEKAETKSICIVAEEAIPMKATDVDFQNIVLKLLDREVTSYVVVYADSANAEKLLGAVKHVQNALGRFTFLGTSSWGESISNNLDAAKGSITISLDQTAAYKSEVDAFWNYFQALKPSQQTHNDKWFREYWEKALDCSFHPDALNLCDETTMSLAGRVSLDVYVPYTIMAVDAIVKGVKAAAENQCSDDYNLCSNLLNNDNRGSNIHDNIREVQKDMYPLFDDNGDVAQRFTAYKINRVENQNGMFYDPIGSYVNGILTFNRAVNSTVVSRCPNNPCTECGIVAVTTPTLQTTTPRTNYYTNETLKQIFLDLASNFTARFKGIEFTGVSFYKPTTDRTSDEWATRFEIGQKWIIPLGVLAGLGILSVIVFEIYILYKLLGTREGRQWRTMWLGQLLLLGLFLSYLTLFAYIPVPTKATCGLTRFGVGLSYAVCFAVLLVKLMVLLTSRSTDAFLPGDIESPNYLKGIYQFLMFIFCVGVQVVIDIQWLIQVPPEAVQVVSNSGAKVWICNHYTWSWTEPLGKAQSISGIFDLADNILAPNMTVFVRTEFENHLLSLVYIMFLILITSIVAMRAHGIITNHRESVFIGIAAGFSIPIWIAWGLVGGLNKTAEVAQEYGDASIAFGLFLTATLILFAMFLPKVRQLVNIGVEGIYLEDDRDTYYGGSVIMAPPSYKSRPSSVIYVNSSTANYENPYVIGVNGDPHAVHLKHPGSTYSAPAYMKRPGSQLAGSKVLKVTGDLTGKHPTEPRRPASEAAYVYRKAHSESGGGTLRRSRSQQDLGAL